MVNRKPPPNARKMPLPPYVAYTVFKKAVAQLKGGDMPLKVTWKSFPSFTTAINSQLAKAFKFLGLIDGMRVPSDTLIELVAVSGTTRWPNALERVLREAFRPIFVRDGPYTREELTERFAQYYEGQLESRQKAARFLFNALEDIGLSTDAGEQVQRKDRRFAAQPNISAVSPGNRKPVRRTNGRGIATDYQVAFNVLMNEIYDTGAMEAGSDEEKAVFLLARFLRSRV